MIEHQGMRVLELRRDGDFGQKLGRLPEIEGIGLLAPSPAVRLAVIGHSRPRLRPRRVPVAESAVLPRVLRGPCHPPVVLRGEDAVDGTTNDRGVAGWPV